VKRANSATVGAAASERLATILLVVAGKGGTGLVRLPMSRSDIADYVGLTKQSVCRVLSAFRGYRLIRLKAVTEIEILDRQALENIAKCGA